MAKMISDEEAARRLAKAIASDIKLYNEEAVSSGADLTSAVAGRPAKATGSWAPGTPHRSSPFSG